MPIGRRVGCRNNMLTVDVAGDSRRRSSPRMNEKGRGVLRGEGPPGEWRYLYYLILYIPTWPCKYDATTV